MAVQVLTDNALARVLLLLHDRLRQARCTSHCQVRQGCLCTGPEAAMCAGLITIQLWWQAGQKPGRHARGPCVSKPV